MDRRTFPPAPKCSTQWGCPSAPSHQSLNPCCPPALPLGSPGGAGRRGRISLSCWRWRGRGLRAAGCAHGRGQDAGGLPAEPGRAGRRRARPRTGARAAYALHLAVEGAGRRRGAQPRSARSPRWGCRSASRRARATPPPHKRAAPDERPARHPADHARAARLLLRASEARDSVRRPAARDARRAAFARHLQARRPAVARPRAALQRLAPGLRRRPLGHGARADDLRRWLVPQGRRRRRAADGRPGDRARAARRRASTSWNRSGALPLAGHTAQHAMARDLRRHRASTRPRWSSSTRACRPSSCSRSSGGSTRTALPIALHHGSLAAGSGARSRRRWRGASCAPSSAPRRSTSASTGATSTSSSTRRAQGREPADAAHRPRQPPAGRALRGAARAGQPLRDPGMPGRARRGRPRTR